MAQGGVQVTGLREFAGAITRLPGEVRSLLQGVAQRTANGLAAKAIGNARAYGWKRLPLEIRTAHVSAKQFFRVEVAPTPPRPANLPLWLEYGTVKMSARPFIGPPTRAAQAAYPAAVDAALQAAFDGTVSR